MAEPDSLQQREREGRKEPGVWSSREIIDPLLWLTFEADTFAALAGVSLLGSACSSCGTSGKARDLSKFQVAVLLCLYCYSCFVC